MTIHDPLLNLKVTSSVCTFVAACTTVFRLYARRGRYWWDDGCAFFSLLALLLQVGAVFMHVPNPAELSKTNRVAAYYLIATSFYAIIWPARLSILFSIMRIETDPDRRRRLAWIAGAFTLAACILISQLFWVCEPEPHWKDTASPQCVLNKQVAICQLISDIGSDLILILAPLNLIRNLQDVALRRRLTLIFSTSIVTTIVSLVHAALILNDGGVKVLLAAFVENTISLIVCNLPVLAAAVFRLKSANGKDEDVRPLSTVRWKHTFTGRSSRGSRGRRTNPNGTVDITTTIALDEMYDERTTTTLPPYKSVSSMNNDTLGTFTVNGVTTVGAPPPVHVGYPHREWEGPDTGTPFGQYLKSPKGALEKEHQTDRDDKSDADSTAPREQTLNRKKSSQSAGGPGFNETQTRVMFAEQPLPPPRDPRPNLGSGPLGDSREDLRS